MERGRRGRAGALEFPAGVEHGEELLRRDVVAMHAQEKTIEQRFQRVLFGQVIARADEHERLEAARFFSTSENLFVQREQQAVEDGAVGIEEFVEKNERRLRQHALGVREQFALAEFAQIERAEEFVRFGETREQIVKAAPFEPRGDVMHERTFRSARRPEDEQVFATHKAQAEQVDDFVLADKTPLHRIEHFGVQAASEIERGGVILRDGVHAV